MSVTERDSNTEPESMLITIMSVSPEQKISDGISNLRNFFQNILKDSNNKENGTPSEATRVTVSGRKRTRGGTKVNYAALLGKRGCHIKQEEASQEECCLHNEHDDVTRRVYKRSNMIKESALPTPAKRHYPAKPDQTVYAFPKEWSPESNNAPLSVNSSAMEIDAPPVRMDLAQMRDYHYVELLDTPISHRTGRSQKQNYFSSCLSSEKIRLACIDEVARRLRQESCRDTPCATSGLRNDTKRGNSRLRDATDDRRDAEKVVDDLLYLRELLEATESINHQVQVIKKTFEERGVGPAPDKTDPLALALELKSRLALKYQPITDDDIYTNN
ncbi:uncharacterized protein LOC121384145 [Gigantopelta aegis]|uniref:uncharacterized protein LOC121384145 n=1 Tax=Gigantopelta aegis TaxID=1735272 RepID=UPI001B88D260|nr:uncharacterized protein LOC121384145 [Gigantopelta aegis]